MKKLSTKISLWICGFLIVTVSFLVLLTHYLYERLYVEDTKNSLVQTGEKLAMTYDGGEVEDRFIQEVDRYNLYSSMNVFAVRNPRELSACVPFDIDYDTLIRTEEREQLLKGETVTKQGYEKRFDRQVISVIVPLVDQHRLEGIVYVYFPLEKITAFVNKDIILIITVAILFLLCMSVVVIKAVKLTMKPLHLLENAAKELKEGRYETRVAVKTNDEVGKLAVTFNEMAAAIEKTDEQQKEFLANVSHELRTPISYIKGYSEMLAEGFVSEQLQREKLRLLQVEASRMEKLTSELLQLARAENKQCMTKTPLVAAESLREVLVVLREKWLSKNIMIRTRFDEMCIVASDELKFKQIVVNVLENAIHYSENNSEIFVTLRQCNERAQIEITDQGIGISEEHLAHVKERFYRVNKARTRQDGGSGLGLSIVDQLVQQHDGTWQMKSTLGEGTVVTIDLPLWEDSDEAH